MHTLYQDVKMSATVLAERLSINTLFWMRFKINAIQAFLKPVKIVLWNIFQLPLRGKNIHFGEFRRSTDGCPKLIFPTQRCFFLLYRGWKGVRVIPVILQKKVNLVVCIIRFHKLKGGNITKEIQIFQKNPFSHNLFSLQ